MIAEICGMILYIICTIILLILGSFSFYVGCGNTIDFIHSPVPRDDEALLIGLPCIVGGLILLLGGATLILYATGV